MKKFVFATVYLGQQRVNKIKGAEWSSRDKIFLLNSAHVGCCKLREFLAHFISIGCELFVTKVIERFLKVLIFLSSVCPIRKYDVNLISLKR